MKSASWSSAENPSAEEREDFYQKLRQQVRTWSEQNDPMTKRGFEFVLAAPDLFHLLCKLLVDARVPAGAKTKLAFVAVYFISPMDLLPEAMFGPIGFLDDVALTAAVLKNLFDVVDVAIMREHWAGEEDVLTVVQRLVKTADEKVGSGLMRRIRKLLA